MPSTTTRRRTTKPAATTAAKERRGSPRARDGASRSKGRAAATTAAGVAGGVAASERASRPRKKVTKEAASRLESVKAVHEVVEKAAEIKKAVGKRTHAPKSPTVKAGAAAAAVAAGISIACDIDKVRKGSMTKGEALENAAWAGGEAAVCTVATAAVTTAAARHRGGHRRPRGVEHRGHDRDVGGPRRARPARPGHRRRAGDQLPRGRAARRAAR